MDEPTYHGIIVNLSQKRKTLKELKIIGKRNVLFRFLVIHKIEVKQEEIDNLIMKIQHNMKRRVLFLAKEFYCHFYRNDELIIVFRERVFRASTQKTTWSEAIDYGKSIGIPTKQLDFIPNRIADETY
jgi:hypothetical protein